MNLKFNQEINLDQVLIDAKPKGIIHAGAYIGGCKSVYNKHGIKDICWIEADPETFNTLKTNVPDDNTLNYAVCNYDGKLTFNVTSNGQSSSLLPLKNHSLRYPGIVTVKQITVEARKIDTLIDDGLIDISKYDFLLMDLQGAEYYAMEGFKKHIDKINYIVAEVNFEELYKGCYLSDTFDDYLSGLGFKKVMGTRYTYFGWGDSYYKRS